MSSQYNSIYSSTCSLFHETRCASDHGSWSGGVNTGDQIAGRLCQAMRRRIALSVSLIEIGGRAAKVAVSGRGLKIGVHADYPPVYADYC